MQNPKPALVQILLHRITTRTLRQIRFRTVLARKKSSRQRVIRNYTDMLALTQRLQFVFVNSAVVKIVERLKTLISRQAQTVAHLQRFLDSRRAVIRSADRPHLPFLDQLIVSLERLFERRRRMAPMRVIEIDIVSLQTLQRLFSRT